MMFRSDKKPQMAQEKPRKEILTEKEAENLNLTELVEAILTVNHDIQAIELQLAARQAEIRAGNMKEADIAGYMAWRKSALGALLFKKDERLVLQKERIKRGCIITGRTSAIVNDVLWMVGMIEKLINGEDLTTTERRQLEDIVAATKGK